MRGSNAQRDPIRWVNLSPVALKTAMPRTWFPPVPSGSSNLCLFAGGPAASAPSEVSGSNVFSAAAKSFPIATCSRSEKEPGPWMAGGRGHRNRMVFQSKQLTSCRTTVCSETMEMFLLSHWTSRTPQPPVPTCKAERTLKPRPSCIFWAC